MRAVGVVLAASLAALVLVPLAWAPAPRGSVQYVGLVLKKVDDSTPPSYTPEFFSSGGRTLLATDVEGVVRVMADPANNDPTTWCTGIQNVLAFATSTNRYFDISQTSNPALDDFKKDWLKLKQQANCPRAGRSALPATHTYAPFRSMRRSR